jgi:hypothetical protein
MKKCVTLGAAVAKSIHYYETTDGFGLESKSRDGRLEIYPVNGSCTAEDAEVRRENKKL